MAAGRDGQDGGRVGRALERTGAGPTSLSLDISWLKDESLEDSATLPEPDVLAAEIIEDLRAALEQLEAIQADLSGAMP